MRRVQYVAFVLSVILICIIAWTPISGFWLSLFVFAVICSIAVMFVALKLDARWRDEKMIEVHKKELGQLEAEVKKLNEAIVQVKQQSEELTHLPILTDNDFMSNVQLLENFFERIVADQSMKEAYARYFRQTKDAKCAKEVVVECRNSIVRPFLEALSRDELPLTDEYKAELLEQLVELAMICIDICENSVFYTDESSKFKPYVALLKGLKTRKEIVEGSKEITNYPDTTPRNARVIKELLAQLDFKRENLAYFGYKIINR